jgi:hypothetical protein
MGVSEAGPHVHVVSGAAAHVPRVFSVLLHGDVRFGRCDKAYMNWFVI